MQWQLKAVVAAVSMAACAAVSAHGSSNAASNTDRATSSMAANTVTDAKGRVIPRDCAAMTGDAQVQCIQDQQSRNVLDNDRTPHRQGMTRGGGTSAAGNCGNGLRFWPVPFFRFTVTNDGQSPSAQE